MSDRFDCGQLDGVTSSWYFMGLVRVTRYRRIIICEGRKGFADDEK